MCVKLINYGLKKDEVKNVRNETCTASIYIENVENSEVDLVLTFYSFYVHMSEYY